MIHMVGMAVSQLQTVGGEGAKCQRGQAPSPKAQGLLAFRKTPEAEEGGGPGPSPRETAVASAEVDIEESEQGVGEELDTFGEERE